VKRHQAPQGERHTQPPICGWHLGCCRRSGRARSSQPAAISEPILPSLGASLTLGQPEQRFLSPGTSGAIPDRPTWLGIGALELRYPGPRLGFEGKRPLLRFRFERLQGSLRTSLAGLIDPLAGTGTASRPIFPPWIAHRVWD